MHEKPQIYTKTEFYAKYGGNHKDNLKRFIYKLFWPKLDVNVTKLTTHYIQIPFSFHRVNYMQSCTLLPRELLTAKERDDLDTLEDMIQRSNNTNKQLKYCNFLFERIMYTLNVLGIEL